MTEQEEINIGKVVRGAAHIYIATIATSILGYIYWFIASRLVTPEDIGEASTAINIASMISAAALLGIPLGVQRFIGKAYAERDIEGLKRNMAAALVILSTVALVVSIILSTICHQLSSFLRISLDLMVVTIMLIAFTILLRLLRAIHIAILKTKFVLITDITSAVMRLVLGIALILIGLRTLGIALGWFTYLAVGLAAYTTLLIKNKLLTKPKSATKTARELLKAGMANWIPTFIATLGTNLGVVVVFSYKGALQAGLYFIAYTAASIVLAIPTSVMRVAYPVLSGMKDDREEAIWKAMKLSLAVTAPIAVMLAVYGDVALTFLNPEYSKAKPILAILLIGVAPWALASGINAYAYAIGAYSAVLALGLATNIPRSALYLAATPLLGGIGAAISYTMGTISGVAVATAIAKKLQVKFRWRHISLLLATPTAIGLACNLVNISWYLGAPAILILSAIAYIKSKILAKGDIIEIVEALLSSKAKT